MQNIRRFVRRVFRARKREQEDEDDPLAEHASEESSPTDQEDAAIQERRSTDPEPSEA